VNVEQFLENNGFLLVTLVQQALLGLSLYFPLMAGQLSLASPGFYAIGGYIAAIIGTHDYFAPWRDLLGAWIFPLEWLLAALVSALLALVVGIPALRLRGIYLALATIAFVEILRVLSLNLEITGGAIGIFGVPQLFEGRFAYMLIFAPFLAATLAFGWRLERSRVGRAFKAIREDELAADAMGVQTTRYKVLAFVIGAVLAGVVGAMSAPFLNTWNARQGTFDASIAYLAYVLIGGSHSVWGPFCGGILLSALPELLRPLKDSRLIINGLVLVFVSVYLPQGISGLFARLSVLVTRRARAGRQPQEGA
jgi:branched-chain amino acid transport system permease protein